MLLMLLGDHVNRFLVGRSLRRGAHDLLGGRACRLLLLLGRTASFGSLLLLGRVAVRLEVRHVLPLVLVLRVDLCTLEEHVDAIYTKVVKEVAYFYRRRPS